MGQLALHAATGLFHKPCMHASYGSSIICIYVPIDPALAGTPITCSTLALSSRTHDVAWHAWHCACINTLYNSYMYRVLPVTIISVHQL